MGSISITQTSQYTIHLSQCLLFLFCVICSSRILPILLLSGLTVASQCLKRLLSSTCSVIKSSSRGIKSKHLTFSHLCLTIQVKFIKCSHCLRLFSDKENKTPECVLESGKHEIQKESDLHEFRNADDAHQSKPVIVFFLSQTYFPRKQMSDLIHPETVCIMWLLLFTFTHSYFLLIHKFLASSLL